MSDQNPHTLVYRYHCEPASSDDEALFCEQLRLASEYRRDLAAIENRHRALQRAWGARYAQCTVERREIRKDSGRWDAVLSLAADHASGAADEPFHAAQQRIAAAGVSLLLAEATLDQSAINHARSRAVRRARERAVDNGLCWGTYQHSEEAFSAQCRTTHLIDDIRIPPFASAATAIGCVAVHMQPARQLRGWGDNWFRIGSLTRRGSEIDRSGRVRPTRHYKIDIRVGTQPDRAPRWASVLALLSRPIPVDAVVRWAMVKRRRIGPMFRWELLIVIDTIEHDHQIHRGHEVSAFSMWAAGDSKRKIARDLLLHIRDARLLAAAAERAGIRQGSVPGGFADVNDERITLASSALNELLRERRIRPRAEAAGIDIGWRQLDQRVRIAYWWGTDGRSGELAIPNSVLDADKFADELRARRANNMNAMCSRIIQFVNDLSESPVDSWHTPLWEDEWLIEETSSIALWRRPSRFVRLLFKWRSQRLVGDEVIMEEFESWQKEDRRLWAWEAGIRDKRCRRVDAQVRCLVAKMCQEYSVIALEAPFIASIVRRPKRCSECEALTKRCANCQDRERLRVIASRRVPHAAPARTRSLFLSTAPRRGARIVEIDPAYTTVDCSSCGHRRVDVDDWSELHIGCSNCGAVEDQDLTAGKNLARRACDPNLVSGKKTDKRRMGPRLNRKKKQPAESGAN